MQANISPSIYSFSIPIDSQCFVIFLLYLDYSVLSQLLPREVRLDISECVLWSPLPPNAQLVTTIWMSVASCSVLLVSFISQVT